MRGWAIVWIGVACGGEVPPLSGACELAAETATCASCDSGGVTCTFEGTSATLTSCGDCQARSRLYQQLCDEDDPTPRAGIEARTVCKTVVCEVWYDGCADACVPLCDDAAAMPQTQCDYVCYGTFEPEPGDCTWVGAGCDWD